MAQDIVLVLFLLCLFQIKHMFADFFLQTPKMLSGRSAYVHMGRAQHAAVHGLGSALVFLVVGAGVVFVVLMFLAEWVVHFHIDWAKARYSQLKSHTPVQAGFWHAIGVDQAAHQLTYIAMAAVWSLVYLPSV
ncbi:MAG: DUF3307 domain-containing protein [Pseudomonadota bacterium]